MYNPNIEVDPKYNITANSEAYKMGQARAEEHLAIFRQNNQPIMVPSFTTEPTSEAEIYFRRGYEDKFKEVTGLTNQVLTGTKPFDARLAKGKKGGKKRKNCIDREINNNKQNKNFLLYYGDKAIKEYTRLAKQIINDFAHANIDCNMYVEVFTNERFIDSLLQAAHLQAYHYGRVVQYAETFKHKCMETGEEFNYYDDGFLNYYRALARINQLVYESLVPFRDYLKQGVFQPEILNRMQEQIYQERLGLHARDPYEKMRV